jgi:hypothetical protein
LRLAAKDIVMGSVIAALEKETGRKCFDTFRCCLDHERTSLVEYDDIEKQFMSAQGETIRYGGPRNIASIAKTWQEREPVFRFFLDGSRRTYKIADIPIGTQVFPIIAGQVLERISSMIVHGLSKTDLCGSAATTNVWLVCRNRSILNWQS